jgi:hypothetical protein
MQSALVNPAKLIESVRGTVGLHESKSKPRIQIRRIQRRQYEFHRRGANPPTVDLRRNLMAALIGRNYRGKT